MTQFESSIKSHFSAIGDAAAVAAAVAATVQAADAIKARRDAARTVKPATSGKGAKHKS